MRILLLEDEMMLQSSIVEYLETLGHECVAFSDGLQAQYKLETNQFDLLILDINVPNIDGLSLFKKLQNKQCFTPAIFISALVDIQSISDAFNLGAEDYIKKPFHLKELGLRVQKISKQIENTQRKHILLSLNYSYNKQTNELFYNKNLCTLTKKQSDIIECLCANVGTIISVDILREYVWNGEPVSDATIRTEISRLRKVLKEDFIQNHKGIGYKIDRFITKV